MILGNFGFQSGTSGGGNVPTSLNYGLWTQITDSADVINTIVETSILGTGIGTLSVPENTFQIGDTFHLKMCGVISSKNNAQLTIRLHANGLDLATTGILTLVTSSKQVWELAVDFTIRQIGGIGIAEIVTNGNFNYKGNASASFEGVNFRGINNSTFNTTIPNTLDVVAQWGSADPLNSIFSIQSILTKTF